ncbi:MAG: glycosyl hydrolase [Pseudomonadota bacterium]
MRFITQLTYIVIFGFFLTACGGGGDGGGDKASVPAKISSSSIVPASSSVITSSSFLSYSSSPSSTRDVNEPLKLSNPNPSLEAVALFDYLKDQHARKTLTGQQESTWASGGPLHELNFIFNATGKAPALLGLDYLNHLDSTYITGVTQRAADWYLTNNGIPTICWHWGSPSFGQGYDNSKKPFDIDKALTPGTTENIAMLKDLDIVAAELAKLRDQNVPILWRPFHEFTGTWFWWGMDGADKFKRLWIYMYNYYTINKGLNNLIWVLGYSGEPSAAYFPGDAYIDIAGADTYVSDHGSLKTLYDRVALIVGAGRPIALHENGPIPDPDSVMADAANWSYFMTWHTSFLTDGIANTTTTLNKAFNHEHYITRDELPSLPNYKSTN